MLVVHEEHAMPSTHDQDRVDEGSGARTHTQLSVIPGGGLATTPPKPFPAALQGCIRWIRLAQLVVTRPGHGSATRVGRVPSIPGHAATARNTPPPALYHLHE